jgi:hypothetical protein
MVSGLRHRQHIVPDTWVTLPPLGEETMPWKECSVMDERMQFVVRRRTEGGIGTKEVHDDIWLVSFMDYDLGYIDLEEKTLQPLENPFGPRV